MIQPCHFTSFGDNHPRPTTWKEIHQRITSTNNEVFRLTRLSREKKAEGDIKGASKLKSSMGFYTPAVMMKDGRKEINIEAFTQQCMCDFDYISRNHISLLVQRVASDPHTRLAHITNSEEGIRIIFDWKAVTDDGEVIPEDFFRFTGFKPGKEEEKETHEEFMARCLPYHHQAWMQGNLYYQHLLDGAAIDEHCKDPNRISFYCHDMHAYLNEEPEPMVISLSDGTLNMADDMPSPSIPTTTAPVMTVANNTHPTQAPQIDASIILRLFDKHAYVPGHRHKFWLTLGARLRFFHCPQKLFAQYKQEALRILGERGLLLHDDPSTRLVNEIENCLAWGYEHGTEADNGWMESYEHQKHATDKATENDEPSQDDLIEHNCPLFPDTVYQNLPLCVLEGLAPVLDFTWDPITATATTVSFKEEIPRRRADALLLSLLTNYSALCSNTHLLYGNRDYSPNLGFLCLAPAGNGKSIIEYGFRIIESTDRYLEKISADEHKAWEEQECKGDEPQPHLLAMPGTTSRSQFTLCMNAMGKGGLIMNSTEINTLISTLKLDVGNFVDLLCKAMMNEQITQFFKVDNKPIKIKSPKLSVCMSGTFDQFHHFIRSIEDGLYSRFFILMMEQHTEWISQKPDPKRGDYSSIYNRLSDDALQMWLMLNNNPTWVYFTDEQWDDHTQRFSEHITQLVQEGSGDHAAIINRHGLGQMRIAAILTAIRKWEIYKNTPFTASKNSASKKSDLDTKEDFTNKHRHMTCSDKDYHTAALITSCLMSQSLHLSTTMSAQQLRHVQPMQKWSWVDDALRSLPATFTIKDWLRCAEELKRSTSQAYRSIRTLVQNAKVRKATQNGVTTYYKSKK